MNNKEAVNWLINISADIGKAKHSDLWHYEQALTEIRGMLESAQISQKGTTKDATSDTISRQTAIDAVHKNYDTILDFKSDGRTVADSFEDIINALPPAQPEPERTMEEFMYGQDMGNPEDGSL